MNKSGLEIMLLLIAFAIAYAALVFVHNLTSMICIAFALSIFLVWVVLNERKQK